MVYPEHSTQLRRYHVLPGQFLTTHDHFFDSPSNAEAPSPEFRAGAHKKSTYGLLYAGSRASTMRKTDGRQNPTASRTTLQLFPTPACSMTRPSDASSPYAYTKGRSNEPFTVEYPHSTLVYRSLRLVPHDKLNWKSEYQGQYTKKAGSTYRGHLYDSVIAPGFATVGWLIGCSAVLGQACNFSFVEWQLGHDADRQHHKKVGVAAFAGHQAGVDSGTHLLNIGCLYLLASIVAVVHHRFLAWKKIWYYLPYASIFCFVSEVIGIAIWDKYSKATIAAVKQCLRILNLSMTTQLVWGEGALAGTIAATVILAIGMLGLGAGRCMLAYTADRTGATRMGGRLVAWMWFDAIFIIMWFILTLWLLVVLLGECLWLAGAWAMTVAIKVGSAAAQYSQDTGQGNTTVSYNREAAAPCALGCVDLAAFEWALGSSTCFCELDVVQEVDASMKVAISHMEGSAVGAFMMLVAAMWILMTATAEFGVTRRERQLLRRIAKARLAASGENTRLLPGANTKPGKSSKGVKASNGSINARGGENVVVDPDTGEVLDIEPGVDHKTPPASSSLTGIENSSDRGRGRGSGFSMTNMTKGISKGIGKSLTAASSVIDKAGGLFRW